MASKVVRINDEAIAIASQYSENLSVAILIMQAKLDELQNNTIDKDALKKLIRKEVDAQRDENY